MDDGRDIRILLDVSSGGFHFRDESIAQSESSAIVLHDRCRQLCVSRFVES
jgi:hypothetical protein